MKKKLFVSISAAMLAGTIFTSPAFAKSPNAKESLVALGDSITYGLNLGANNQHPSKFAFPYLIENDGKDFRVRNLGVPGWRSDQLLNALLYDEKFRQAVRHADYITLDIGSNDLLQGLKKYGPDQEALIGILGLMLGNLQSTIAEIRSLTDAPIVVYNIYNPFQPENTQLYGFGESFLPTINSQIFWAVQSTQQPEITIADAYDAFQGKQGKYLLPDDVHPTVEGQQVLADLAEEVLGLR